MTMVSRADAHQRRHGISPKIAWNVLDSLPANPRAVLAMIAEHAGARPAAGPRAAGAPSGVGGGKPATKAQVEFDYLT
jgi:hypothetical protein